MFDLTRPQVPDAVQTALRGLYGRLVAHRVHGWESGYDPTPIEGSAEQPANVEDADVVSSLLAGNDLDRRHLVLLDIDMPVYAVPSTAEGHGHLYIDVPGGVPHDVYMRLLDVLAEAKIIEDGYRGASQRRGYTSLRPFWKKKGRPILRCARCGKRAEEIEEYRTAWQGEQDHEAEEAWKVFDKVEGYREPTATDIQDYVWDNEGTLDRKSGLFACTECYIAMGQPSSPTGWTPAPPETSATSVLLNDI